MIKLNSRNRTFFYLLLLFAGYVAYVLLRPYLGVVVFSMVVVMAIGRSYAIRRVAVVTSCASPIWTHQHPDYYTAAPSSPFRPQGLGRIDPEGAPDRHRARRAAHHQHEAKRARFVSASGRR